MGVGSFPKTDFNPPRARLAFTVYTLDANVVRLQRSNGAGHMPNAGVEASPVSTNDQIKVEAKFDPKPTEENWEERQDVVAWALAIAPNETLKFSVGYATAIRGTGRWRGCLSPLLGRDTEARASRELCIA